MKMVILGHSSICGSDIKKAGYIGMKISVFPFLEDPDIPSGPSTH